MLIDIRGEMTWDVRTD